MVHDVPNKGSMIVQNDSPEITTIDIENSFDFTEGGLLGLIDADPIAYKAAAACDSATHLLKINGNVVHTVEGGVTEFYDTLNLANKQALVDMLENNPALEYERLVNTDESDNMFHTIKAQVKRIIKKNELGGIRLFLTDSASNFRVTNPELTTVLKYKGNRSPDAKPTKLSEARKYLEDILGAEMVTGMEADDALAIAHRDAWNEAVDSAVAVLKQTDEDGDISKVEAMAMDLSETLLITIDKDIKMVPGKFYNPDLDEGILEILPMGHIHLIPGRKSAKATDGKKAVKSKAAKIKFSGLKGFYAQLLLGDSCDNIPGAYFCGDTAVHKILGELDTEKELFQAVYRETYEGIHRDLLRHLSGDLDSRVDTAISLGQGNDNPSNRSKLKKKYKEKLNKNTSYGDMTYFHWSQYKLKEDGTVGRELIENHLPAISISPLNYLLETARLINMLHIEPQEDGSHLWYPANQAWIDEVDNEYALANLERVQAAWPV